MTEKFVKKLFGEKNIEAVLQRLNRLTQEEEKLTAAQILEVVHGLVQNMSVVSDGEQSTRLITRRVWSIIHSRQQSIARLCPECPWYVFEVPTNHPCV
jgi:hypothetical protein